MIRENRLIQRPMLFGLSAILAVALGFTALVSFGGQAFAQTPGGTSTATATATTPSPSATGSATSGSSAASPTAPTTGTAAPDGGSSNSALILVGGIAVVGASLAAMGYSLRKRQ